MTNLYDFLRRIQIAAEENDGDVMLHDHEREWLKQFLESPGHEIHFKAHQVGTDKKTGEPIYSQHYQIAGGGADVFSLLTEAMLQNATFASQVVLATRFFFEHLPFCESCKKRYHAAEAGQVSWIMSPHKPLK